VLIAESVTLAIVVVEEIECPFELESDASETESEGPTATSNGVTSNISTSPGCVCAYDSDKDGEGGVVFKDVYLEFVVLVADAGSIEFGNDAEIVGAKVGSCKELDGFITGVGINSTDEGQTFNQLLDDSFSLDAEQDSIS
jgi:hypothetical protein